MGLRQQRAMLFGDEGFGNTWTLGEVANYYEGANQIEHTTAIPNSDDIAIMNGTTGGAEEGVCRITSGGGGVPVWRAQPFANMRGSGDTHDLLAATATHVFASYRFSTTRRVSKIDVETGTTIWSVNPASNGKVLAITAAGELFACASGANQTREIDGNSASPPSQTLLELEDPSATVFAAVLSEDDSLLYTLDQSEQLCIHNLADRPGGGGLWPTAITVDLTSDPAVPWTSVTGGAWASRSRDNNDGIWLLTEGEDTLLKYGPDGSELPGSGIDWRADMITLTGAGSFSVNGLAVDRFGFVYVTVLRVGQFNHVLKYTPQGVLVTSTVEQGLAMYSTDVALGLVVSEKTGIIWAVFDDGFTQEIFQS